MGAKSTTTSNHPSTPVDLGGRPEVISLDRLKAVYTDSIFPASVAQPKRRGRPPKKFTKDK